MSSYISGEYKAKCFDCGFTFLAGELKRHWTGVFKCELCWEARHPQDFVRAPLPEMPPKWTQPEPADLFLDVPVYEELSPVIPDNPPPNPGGGNTDPPEEEPPPDEEEPGEEIPPNQDSLWLDHNGDAILDHNGQPIWS